MKNNKIQSQKLNDMDKILRADHHDPFQLLGMHREEGRRLIVSAFHPQAEAVSVVSFPGGRVVKKLEKIHPDGFFQGIIKNRKNFFGYLLKIIYKSGEIKTIQDPYSFEPQVSDYNLHLFSEGSHNHAYNFLGAHIKEVNGVKGTLFCVWAPSAKRVSVVGDFNNWDGRVHQMRNRGVSGVWELFVPYVAFGEKYKYEIRTSAGKILLKSDPYAFYSELRPKSASVVWDIKDNFKWSDDKYLEERKVRELHKEPVLIYEVHPGSWKRKNRNEFLNYREFADDIVPYAKKMGFNYIELLSIAEHPLDDSWGYQVIGYYSPTSRFGTPEDFKYFVNLCHINGLGVIIDWVGSHFPRDGHGLIGFDGSHLYEHSDPKKSEQKDWGTLTFNYSRNEVKNFLLSNGIFWFDVYHIDGLRMDAVASVIYLDYSRKEGEWIPNIYGGNENLEAIEFLRHFNKVIYKYYPGVIMAAEESTAFRGVSHPVETGGLGFGMKWNMGWMHDSLQYISNDPVYRKYHHGELTFSLLYTFNENFILVLSHDEVVHGKRSLLEKMPGDDWQKFANLRLLLGYIIAHPGKKLLFMGGEFAQRSEWNFRESLDWHLLEYEPHRNIQKFVQDINHLYLKEKPLYQSDFYSEGFEWIDFNDAERSITSFVRWSLDKNEFLVFVFNWTPVVRHSYRLGVPVAGGYSEILNSDSKYYGGSNVGNIGVIQSHHSRAGSMNDSIEIVLPPLAAVVFALSTKT